MVSDTPPTGRACLQVITQINNERKAVFPSASRQRSSESIHVPQPAGSPSITRGHQRKLYPSFHRTNLRNNFLLWTSHSSPEQFGHHRWWCAFYCYFYKIGGKIWPTTVGRRTFPFAASLVWNTLSSEIFSVCLPSTSENIFFRQSFPDIVLWSHYALVVYAIVLLL